MPLSKVLPATVPIGEPFHAMIRPRSEADARLGVWARRIGRVHGARRREGVTAWFDEGPERDEGEYRFDARTGVPISIRIPSGTDAPECVFLHEVGHYVDQRHLGDGVAFASESDPLARAVVEAAKRAPSLAESIAFVKGLGPDTESRARLLRLLDDREVFARAYTQYVAETMRPPAARMQIARRMIQCREAGAFPLFWEPREFPAIARPMHRLLIEKGLIALRA